VIVEKVEFPPFDPFPDGFGADPPAPPDPIVTVYVFPEVTAKLVPIKRPPAPPAPLDA
jgi:hypothetical protein